MTHHTDAERAKFEAAIRATMHDAGEDHIAERLERWPDGAYKDRATGYAWWGYQQAARRAPAVPVPQSIEQMAVDRYKVVPSHISVFYPCAVVAGDGQQQLYIGREAECQNMARKFTGAFLDGAFVALAAAPQPPEATVKQQLTVEAAPVQLPEPVAVMTDTTPRDPGWKTIFVPDAGTKLYTEQQVRELLAAHGIEVAP